MLGDQEAHTAEFYGAEALHVYPVGDRQTAAVIHEATRAGMDGYNLRSVIHMSHFYRQAGEPVAVVCWRMAIPCWPHQDPTLLAVLGPACILESPVDRDRVKAISRGEEHMPHTAGALFHRTLPVRLWLYRSVLWKEWSWAQRGLAIDEMVDEAKRIAIG